MHAQQRNGHWPFSSSCQHLGATCGVSISNNILGAIRGREHEQLIPCSCLPGSDLGSKPPSPPRHMLDAALDSSFWLLSPHGEAPGGGPWPGKLQTTASTSPQPLHHAPAGHMTD